MGLGGHVTPTFNALTMLTIVEQLDLYYILLRLYQHAVDTLAKSVIHLTQ